jgi:hypothetical protein
LKITQRARHGLPRHARQFSEFLLGQTEVNDGVP